MLRLHLLRHAKTEQTSPTGKDFDRPLMPKGNLQCEGLKMFFKTLPPIDTVYCSMAKRTQQTLEVLLNRLPEPNYGDDLYLCGSKTMLQLLWSEKPKGDILIVGHNFGISDLASYFSDEDIELRTGEYIRLVFDCDNWSETSRGMGVIKERFRPEV